MHAHTCTHAHKHLSHACAIQMTQKPNSKGEVRTKLLKEKDRKNNVRGREGRRGEGRRVQGGRERERREGGRVKGGEGEAYHPMASQCRRGGKRKRASIQQREGWGREGESCQPTTLGHQRGGRESVREQVFIGERGEGG